MAYLHWTKYYKARRSQDLPVPPAMIVLSYMHHALGRMRRGDLQLTRKGPVKTMILQVPQCNTSTTELMQTLLESLPLSHPKRKMIEIDLYKMRSGQSGEKGVSYHLDFWFKNDDRVIVANNLRLEFEGRTAQIDHLVAVPAGFLVLESKALPDHIYISDKEDWFRIRNENGKQVREGIYNPVEQNRRHIAVLEDILRSLKINPLPPALRQ